MTDRIAALTVVLEDDTRDDDIQPIIDAIACLRGVARVDPIVADTTLHIATVRVRGELRARLFAALEGLV